MQIPQDNSLATWEPAFGAAPLSRPDLPQLTDGKNRGMEIVASREQLFRAK